MLINLDTLTIRYNDNTPISQSNKQLILVDPIPLDQNPAAVYLAKLKKISRRPQKSGFDEVAKILSNDSPDCFKLDWSKVRYQQSALV